MADAAILAAAGCALAGLDVIVSPDAAAEVLDAVHARALTLTAGDDDDDEPRGSVVLLGEELPLGAGRALRRGGPVRWVHLRPPAVELPDDTLHVVLVDGADAEALLARVPAAVPRLVVAAPARHASLAPLLSAPVLIAPPPAGPRRRAFAAAPGEDPLRAAARVVRALDLTSAALWLPAAHSPAAALSALDELGVDAVVGHTSDAVARGEAVVVVLHDGALPTYAVEVVVAVGPVPAAVDVQLDRLASGRADGLARVDVLDAAAAEAAPAPPPDLEARLRRLRSAGADAALVAEVEALLAAPDGHLVLAAGLRALLRQDRIRAAEIACAVAPGADRPRRRKRRRRREG